MTTLPRPDSDNFLRGRDFKMPISRTPRNQNGRELAAKTVALALLISSLWLRRSVAQSSSSNAPAIQGKEHYAMRGGLRIYLWEKYRQDSGLAVRFTTCRSATTR
jgi:hypothetical protein